jgi:hypothetical protein
MLTASCHCGKVTLELPRAPRALICGCVTHYQQRVTKPDGSDTLAVNLRNVDRPELMASVPIKLLDGDGAPARGDARRT